jgi:hypothetical protein
MGLAILPGFAEVFSFPESATGVLRRRSLHPALNHFADPDFWLHYRQLPDEIRELADKRETNPSDRTALRKYGESTTSGLADSEC